MKKIDYYVAMSLDGFIAGQNDDVTNFMFQGDGIDQYQRDLQNYKTVIMGRRTYEFGYQFGAVPGQPSPAYPHMKHYILSDNLLLPDCSEQVAIKPVHVDAVREIRETSETDIYLCGGGQLAGWLLNNQQIDTLKIKLNPVVLGKGTRLFEGVEQAYQLVLLDTNVFSDGLQLMTYAVHYH